MYNFLLVTNSNSNSKKVVNSYFFSKILATTQSGRDNARWKQFVDVLTCVPHQRNEKYFWK